MLTHCQLLRKKVNLASKISWNELKKKHIADYQSFYNRCQIELTAKQDSNLLEKSTLQRLVDFEKGKSDVTLPSLYFNFGRYLLISSSRKGGLPANLQGIWAEEYQTPWNSDYHLNINVQMNYWPAEVTNLSESHSSLVNFVKQLVPPGEKTAKAYYNSEGWVAHVITNPWKFTAPGEGASWGSTLSGGAWLCEHLWQHYLFNPNKKVLEMKFILCLKELLNFLKIFLLKIHKRIGWLPHLQIHLKIHIRQKMDLWGRPLWGLLWICK